LPPARHHSQRGKLIESSQGCFPRNKELPPQTALEVCRGLTIRRTQSGIPVARLHYSVHPERDPDTHPEWKAAERKLYTSEGAWQREQEIMDEAGGGELVFADTLVSHWDKIVITAPEWKPDPNCAVEAGFDHGRTNPTALERVYLDFAGTIYFCGEYYQPGREIWEHSPVIREMAETRKIRVCYADPTIFDANFQQSQLNGRPQERAKSVNELYIGGGFTADTASFPNQTPAGLES
jgi:hypothetical protein